MHTSYSINQESFVQIIRKKLLTITKNETRKIKRHMQNKIFDLVKQVIYLIVFNEFVY
jgi:hypothetical protein